MILAFETSTDICSVSFQNSSGKVFEKRIQGNSVHSDHVFFFIREFKNEHSFQIKNLNAVLVSNGPGSYTGLRIAASAIKGLLFGSEVDLFAVNTLAGFTGDTKEDTNGKVIHSVIDARRTHFYHQVFRFGEVFKVLSEVSVKKVEAFESELEEGQVVIGTGLNRLSEQISQKCTLIGSEGISASGLIRLFNKFPTSSIFTQTNVEALDPNYITLSQVNNTKGQDGFGR